MNLVLPNFTPLNNYRYYLVNQSTNTDLIHDLIRLVETCQSFTIDTEFDYYNQSRPALIKIQLIDTYLSTIILVEACHMPSNRFSIKFWLIRSIFKKIFDETKIIYVWGNLIH